MMLKIALLQLLPGGSLAEQQNIGTSACRKAKDMGADIALFPEMWSDGYFLPQEEGAVDALAITADSEFICALKSTTRNRSIPFFSSTEREMKGCTIQKSIFVPLPTKQFFHREKFFM